MIGIIGAMELEIDSIKTIIENSKTKTISKMDFVSGNLEGKTIVAANSGVGKVSAAICAQTMILKYNPEMIIVTGIAGSLDKNLKIGDIAIADKVVQHDCDTTKFGTPPGYIYSLDTNEIKCSDRIVNLLFKISSEIENTSVLKGTIASGDSFICTDKQKERIKNTFGAIVCEMEGGSIGQVCAVNGVDFGVLRAISDNADSNSNTDYNEFKKDVSEKTVHIIKEFVKRI